MAFLAAAAPYISAALSAAGTVMAAKGQAKAAEFNAQIAERNMTFSRENARIEEARSRRLSTMWLGSMRAATGASGIRVEGSPLDLLEESARQGELDAQLIHRQGELGAMSHQANAKLDRMRGEAAQTAGYVQAGSQILSGAASSYSSYRSQGQGLRIA